MKIHEIKLHKNFADDVFNGRKSFEIRNNDRGYQTGDYIKFTVVDDNRCILRHPLNDKMYVITYILSGWGLKENFVAFSIKETTESVLLAEKEKTDENEMIKQD